MYIVDVVIDNSRVVRIVADDTCSPSAAAGCNVLYFKVIDGDVTNSIVQGDTFEVKNIASSGSGRAADIDSYNSNNSTIINNHIHDVHANNPYSYGVVLGNNATPGLVHDILVKNNRIHDIGPAGALQISGLPELC